MTRAVTESEFALLVRATEKELRRFLRALTCGDASFADDLAQESYVKAYLSLASLDDSRKFKSWLFRISINTYFNHLRSLRPHSALSENLVAPAEPCREYESLYAALDGLSGSERLAILLHYMEGYNIREIAAITDSSVDAVKKQLSRGRMHLRHLISKLENNA